MKTEVIERVYGVEGVGGSDVIIEWIGGGASFSGYSHASQYDCECISMLSVFETCIIMSLWNVTTELALLLR